MVIKSLASETHEFEATAAHPVSRVSITHSNKRILSPPSPSKERHVSLPFGPVPITLKQVADTGWRSKEGLRNG